VSRARVLLVRHGSTEYNAKPGAGGESAERIRGWTDVPLDAEGREEAKRIAQRIGDSTSSRFVWTSPLSRAADTARAIADTIDRPVIPERWLKPWNLGEMSGQPVAKLKGELLSYPAHPDKPVKDGESFRCFAERYLTGLGGLLRLAHLLDEDCVAVTHTRCTQLTRAWVAAGCPADLSYDLPTMNDYADEVKPGQELALEPRGTKAAILEGR
jgi:broad specificity phosphatase PhoE